MASIHVAPEARPTSQVGRKTPRHGARHWMIGSAVAVFALLAAGVLFANAHWPYRYRIVKPMLEGVLGSQVQISRYHRTYFPHPGFVAVGITLRRKSAPDLPPLGSVDGLIVQGRWSDLLMLRPRVALVDITALHIVVPAIGSRANHEDFPPGSASDFSGPDTLIDDLKIHRGVLDIMRANGNRYSFPIVELDIRNFPKQLLTSELETKRNQFQQAANVALGVKLTATYDAPPASSPESATMAVPGESIAVKSLGFAKSGIVVSAKLILDAPGCQQNAQGAKSADKPSVAEFDFRMTPCAKAGYTRPYWHRHDPERDALHTIDEPLYQTLPFPPPPFRVRMEYQYQGLAGSIEVPVMVRFKQSDGSEGEHPLAIGPEFSIALSPSNSVIPSDKRGSTSVKTTARDQSSGSEAQIVLNVPNGWRAEPAHESVEIPKNESKDASFQVFPSALEENQTHIRAELTRGGKAYGEGYTVVDRKDLGTFYYYQPAVQRVSIVDVKVPTDLTIGYIMGAGDDIPTVLEQIGMNVTMIPADNLASEDLSKYQTIVLGIRAYDTQKGVIDNNKRLLDFVENGGRLVVQYNTLGSFGVPIDFNSGKYTPYPATLSRARVSVEEAAVTILDAANPIFHSPNEITRRDFEGWVQERGLYFMSQWDSNFTPLLESHDPEI